MRTNFAHQVRRAAPRAGRAASTPAAAALAAAVAALAFALAGCQAGAGAGPIPRDAVTRQAGALRVSVAPRPETPRLAENRMLLWVRDAAGRPVKGATVQLVASMPAMGSMPRMESRARVVETGPGAYQATYSIDMTGSWDLDLTLSSPGAPPQTLALRVNTGTRGVEFTGGEAAGEASPGATGGATATGTAPGAADGAVLLESARRQELGVRVEAVTRHDLSLGIRAAGRVGYDESHASEVSLKYSGWVRGIKADYTGRAVRAGEELFTAYSPEVYAAQQEFLVALRAAHSDSTHLAPGDLLDSARRRLLLWDLTPAQIDRLAREGRPREALPVAAPAGGVIVEKSVVLGSSFAAGQALYKIAAFDPAWVIAPVYQYQLPLVTPGLRATIRNPYLDGGARDGRVAYVYPSLSAETRTGEVRVEVPNPGQQLKSGMFVDVDFQLPLGRRLAVPVSAVIYTGERRVVFVDRGRGWLAPREVRLGQRAGDYFEVLSGLEEGQRVVTAGNFLIAAESRLKSALDKWGGR
jgi:membrane fusion protein, copper/silver efflux system